MTRDYKIRKNSIIELHRVKERQKKFIEKYRENVGMYWQSVRDLEEEEKDIRLWILRNEWFRDELNRVDEEIADAVERKLLDKITEGSEKSIHYYLDAKGKKRGYGASMGNITVSQGVIVLPTRELLGEIKGESETRQDVGGIVEIENKGA